MGVSAFGELRTLDAMHHDDLLSSLRADAAALLAAARSADPDQVIEACPGWKPIDLVWHIGEVHFFWGTMVRRRFTDPEQVDSLRPERPADDEGVFDFAEGSAEMLIEALSSVDPSTEVWTWSEQKDVAFVIRRMAQETAVHRVDAERAAGNPIASTPTWPRTASTSFWSSSSGCGPPTAHYRSTVRCTCTAPTWTANGW